MTTTILESDLSRPDDERPVVRRRRRDTLDPLGHQPALDGLRAFALIAMLLYHAQFGWIRGGFLSL
jgi:hypothetical protein